MTQAMVSICHLAIIVEDDRMVLVVGSECSPNLPAEIIHVVKAEIPVRHIIDGNRVVERLQFLVFDSL